MKGLPVSPRYGHAAIIGGGMAALWTARILSGHFERVTLIERDQLPAQPTSRAGVPQARHAHILLTGGQRLLEQLFPGLTGALAAAGVPEVDWAANSRICLPTGWTAQYSSGLVTRTCSRDLLEWEIRRRLLSDTRIRLLEGHEVIGLGPLGQNDEVTGVQLRPRPGAHAPAPEGDVLPADLVVDASGRDSRAPEWLAALGYGRPRESIVNAFLGYASRWYERPATFGSDWQALLVSPAPPHQPRGGVIYPIERGRWIVTLTGTARDYPPTDEAGFLDFARSLDTPLLHDAIRDARPLSPIWGYRRTENRLRHYDQLDRRPEGFLVLGDAVCTFNPVYGQGMTASALGALTLDRCLREQRRRHPHGDLGGLAGRFQHRLARSNATPWLLATSEDFRWPLTEGGRRSYRTRIAHHYLDRVLAAVPKERAAQQALLEVLHLVKSPIALAHPRILASVLAEAARALAHRTPPPRHGREHPA